MGRKTSTVSGEKFGFLTAISASELRSGKHVIWNWSCVCGAVVQRSGSYVRRRETASCGCKFKEIVGRPHITHQGSTRDSKLYGTYTSWASMKVRCKEGSKHYKSLYFDRGITVCDEWATDFSRFLADMGIRPSKKYTLDRIDNNKGYFPSNCRWATQEVQSNNKTNNVRVKYQGMEMTLAQWERKLGLTRNSISPRLRLGWSLEDALTTPTKRSVK